ESACSESVCKCLYSGAVRTSFDRPLEHGYLRRRSAPDEVPYDGRVNSIVDPPDEEHQQMLDSLADFEYRMWCASSGWHTWELLLVGSAENEGLALDYAVNSYLQ